VRGRPHAGIIRLVGIRVAEQARVCLAVLGRYGSELEAGAIVTVEPGRVRVRTAGER
jgi:predicted nuclease of predicted toxin-antitoxin system